MNEIKGTYEMQGRSEPVCLLGLITPSDQRIAEAGKEAEKQTEKS